MPLSSLLAPLEAALAVSLAPHLPAAPQICVAYSGGVDSELLTFCLARWQRTHPHISIKLLHVHHGLSQYADDWAKHCQQQAAKQQLPIEVIHVNLKQGARLSLEASAREARYAMLAEHIGEQDLLITGHHLDDQAESFLLALKRGSGPKGLSAMAASQPFAKGRLLRPWLGLRRADIEAAAQALGLSHIEDDSNSNERFDRNFLRHSVLPPLNQRWQGFSQAVARSASLCAEQQSLCDELAQADLALFQHTDGALAIVSSGGMTLAELSVARRNNLLRYWLAQQEALMPSQVQLQAMSPLWLAREDAQPELKWATHCVRRYQQRLYLLTLQPAQTLPVEAVCFEQINTLANQQQWQFVPISSGLRLRPPLTGQQVSVRYGLSGSLKLKPAGRGHSRELKKLWQEYQVPPWQRSQVALLCYDDTVVAALGYWLESHAVCEDGIGYLPTLHNMTQ